MLILNSYCGFLGDDIMQLAKWLHVYKGHTASSLVVTLSLNMMYVRVKVLTT